MAEDKEENPLQSYYEWQVTTVMLARDLVEPLPEGADEDAAMNRRMQVEREVSTMTMQLVPPELQKNPNLDWPAELMRAISAATIRYANHLLDEAAATGGPS
ncbi:MAG: hypothetical protein AAF750_01910 [Planctomycetota bacterium]